MIKDNAWNATTVKIATSVMLMKFSLNLYDPPGLINDFEGKLVTLSKNEIKTGGFAKSITFHIFF